ncbi:unnamed protein product [Musa acuminata subsp. malaccensis]|uniref:(wild Malaysian banana) hypothetical protein n=1 Tax=Musa acuminata subsp. malaccensis TaxID=214687 RepID=A0A8D7FBN2_MUSAM|nr:unnamed protein product [Musa acuminata subsp. malaccensis]
MLSGVRVIHGKPSLLSQCVSISLKPCSFLYPFPFRSHLTHHIQELKRAHQHVTSPDLILTRILPT